MWFEDWESYDEVDSSEDCDCLFCVYIDDGGDKVDGRWFYFGGVIDEIGSWDV